MIYYYGNTKKKEEENEMILEYMDNDKLSVAMTNVSTNYHLMNDFDDNDSLQIH